MLTGVAVSDNGALCVFSDDIRGREADPIPLMAQKNDGGYGYGTPTVRPPLRPRPNLHHPLRNLSRAHSRQHRHPR